MGDHDTGAWLEEAAVPYLLCKKRVSKLIWYLLMGAKSWDQGSMKGDFMTEDCTKFMADEAAQALAKEFKETHGGGHIDVRRYLSCWWPRHVQTSIEQKICITLSIRYMLLERLWLQIVTVPLAY